MKPGKPPAWLPPALAYVHEWMAFQLERYKQPGASIAVTYGSELVLDQAYGVADMRTGKPMTPRHRLRIASHSKTFTAAGVLLLREQGHVALDDRIGKHVPGLHPEVAAARVGEVLSHGAGISRDGDDAGQFTDRRPFLSREELRGVLATKPPLAAGVQMKYSNPGYGLLGLLIEELTGEDYAGWITREVIGPAGLRETAPDMPQLPRKAEMAVGHSAEFPWGRRLVVPGDNPANAIAPAGGFVATAADAARFFAQLAPDAPRSMLTAASRRDIVQRRWRDAQNPMESYYGLGMMMGAPGKREFFGHSGSLQGFLSRTARFPALGCTISVLCNAQDAPSWLWVDGIASILRAFQEHGAPTRRVAGWQGRWWNMFGAIDFVPIGDIVCQVAPALNPPFDDFTTQCTVSGRDGGLVTRASGYNSIGEKIRRVRGADGQVSEVWVGASRLVSKASMLAETTARYQPAERTGKKKKKKKAGA